MRRRLTISPAAALALVATIVLAALGLGRSGWLEQADLLIYDRLLAQRHQAPPDGIVIVAIDEASLQQLGRWPWSTRVHARMIDRLTQTGARAVVLDIPLPASEPRRAAADQTLARALARNGRVVLAAAPERLADGHYPAPGLPPALFAGTAAGVGHVDFDLDPDGRCRRMYLYAGPQVPQWPALALAAFRVGTDRPGGERRLNQSRDPADGWVRQQPVRIPYIGRAGHFRYLSYADVLHGRIDAEQLRDRFVLVGITAGGLGAALSTPAARVYRRMPSVEVHANLLTGLLHDELVTDLPAWSRQLLTGLLVGTPLLAAVVLGHRRAPGLVGGAALLTLLASAALMYGAGRWFGPSSALLTLAMAYLPMRRLRLRTTVQETIRQARQRSRLARLDGLTGLPGRERLLEALGDARAEVLEQGRLLGLLVLDLQDFKTLNQRLGEAAGDALLARAARRIRNVVRKDDLMVRLGGDRFAVMMAGLDNREPLAQLTRRIEHTLRQPFEPLSEPLTLAVHLGAAIFPADAADAETLLHNATTAMRRARDQKIGRLCFYAEQRRPPLRANATPLVLSPSALEGNEIEVRYRPQISGQSGRLAEVEALLWRNDRDRNGTRPAGPVPIAELTAEVGDRLLEQACRQVRRWQDDGLPYLRVALKPAAAQFRRADLVEIVRRILQDAGLKANRLELALGEDILLDDVQAAQERLAALRKLGVRIAVEGFGRGYASLSYLRRLPFDRIRIDESLTAEVEPGGAGTEIARSIISIAHRLQLDVVAEGVETQTQHDVLLEYGCDELQGGMIGGPLPADQLVALLHRRSYLPARFGTAIAPA